MRVMIAVTHLLGTGHLARALTLGRAFAHAGHEVTVASGGQPAPHLDAASLEFVQLPPLRSDGVDFTRLLHPDGTVATSTDLAERTAQLLRCFAETRPDVLITELFPFGRRILREEFRALLDAARPSCPLILSSIRDILAPPSKPAKADFANEMVSAFYDAVLVHADPEIVTLERSWPVSATLAPVLKYTGFVAPPPPETAPERGETILVSAGGGHVGDAIFETALSAAARAPDTCWHMLIGGDAARRDAYISRAAQNVIVEGPRPDFRHLMAQAKASVSMCGYNTALDVLQTGVPAVLIPFDAGNEIEQGLRADALVEQPAVRVMRQDALTLTGLLNAIHEVSNETRAARVHGMNGAAETVRAVTDMWEAHNARA